MSLLALAITAIAGTGILRDPPGDEGALAHSWQLLMGLQIPLIALFAYLAVQRGFAENRLRLGVQVALFCSALVTLRVLGL
jgi:hypothetical protein